MTISEITQAISFNFGHLKNETALVKYIELLELSYPESRLAFNIERDIDTRVLSIIWSDGEHAQGSARFFKLQEQTLSFFTGLVH